MSPHAEKSAAPAAVARPAPQTRRRRGAALERALLDAALAELTEKGYSGLTIESVAARARTSRAVLYRRWATKPALVQAALAHARTKEPVEIPDTGSLRGDMIELLRRTSRSRARIGALVLLQLSAYFAETGTGPAELREIFLPTDRANAFDTVVLRAVDRGEIDPARLTPRIVAVPMDLLRQELMMTLRPVPDEAIASIIDEVFLPLVRPGVDGGYEKGRPEAALAHDEEVALRVSGFTT